MQHASYLLLDALFIVPMVCICIVLRRHLSLRHVLYVLILLLALTAVFDQLIIIAGIVRYRPEHLSGIYIGKAPIEDFGYSLGAAILVPTIWQWIKHYESHTQRSH